MQQNNTMPPISQDTIKSAPMAVCDCGGMIFKDLLTFKKISQFISPTGNDELYPIQVIVCEKCNKIPSWFIKDDVIPKELIATKPII